MSALLDIARNINDLDRRVANLEAQEDIADIIGAYLALPGLRGFWPMSTVDYTNPQVLDLGGGGYHLTNNNAVTFGYDNLAPYANFVAASSQTLSRADGGAGNWADISGAETYVVAGQRGLTLGCCFASTDDANTMMLIRKYGGAGQRSYLLGAYGAVAGDPVRFIISDDGTNTDTISSTNGYSSTAWNFVAARFNDSDTGKELAVFLNGTQTTAATARASIFDSNAVFELGGNAGGPGSFLDGQISMAFLCASALSDAIIGQLYQWSRRLYGV